MDSIGSGSHCCATCGLKLLKYNSEYSFCALTNEYLTLNIPPPSTVAAGTTLNTSVASAASALGLAVQQQQDRSKQIDAIATATGNPPYLLGFDGQGIGSDLESFTIVNVENNLSSSLAASAANPLNVLNESEVIRSGQTIAIRSHAAKVLHVRDGHSFIPLHSPTSDFTN